MHALGDAPLFSLYGLPLRPEFWTADAVSAIGSIVQNFLLNCSKDCPVGGTEKLSSDNKRIQIATESPAYLYINSIISCAFICSNLQASGFIRGH